MPFVVADALLHIVVLLCRQKKVRQPVRSLRAHVPRGLRGNFATERRAAQRRRGA